MLSNNDKRIIKRVSSLAPSDIARLDGSGISHYETGLFNCIEHLCPHSEYHTGQMWDESKCSAKCSNIDKCNLIVNLLCRVKPLSIRQPA